MTAWTVRDPDWERRVRTSFGRQTVMATIGARLVRLEPGRVEISLPHRPDLTQQHGFLHAGMVATVLDSACGYAALTLMPPGTAVLAIEFKVNLMRPAAGDLIARGEVLRAGKTVSTCRADAVREEDGEEIVVATMLGSIMTVTGRDDLTD
ncbi:MAG: PaaI family thioesterase [Gemmatimonadetes bacterium]|nr:PaaI family thioesterase [Gemmatimonadota bacterium]